MYERHDSDIVEFAQLPRFPMIVVCLFAPHSLTRWFCLSRQHGTTTTSCRKASGAADPTDSVDAQSRTKIDEVDLVKSTLGST